jgi:hypothetical protein
VTWKLYKDSNVTYLRCQTLPEGRLIQS